MILAASRRALPAVALAAAAGAAPAVYFRHQLSIARRCPLTGLSIRQAWMEHAARLVQRDPYGEAVIVFVDLDRFKQINDTYGHDLGDKVIQLQASRLRMWCRGRGAAGRLGGDELVAAVRIPNGEVSSALDLLARSLAGPIYRQGTPIPLSASIGACRPAGGSLAATLHTADTAMYEAKHARDASPRWRLRLQPGPEPQPAPVRRVRHHGPDAR